MGLRLYASADEIFAQTDDSVCTGQISIQRQSALALSNALGNSVREDLDRAQDAIGPGMVRRQRQSFDYSRLRRS